MTAKQKQLLKSLALSKEGTVRLNRRNHEAASELIHQGLAIFIPESTGGGWIAITYEGTQAAEKIKT